ncbi:MAG: (deoxy)nucleoside triphosphate pyrophosphohydrolase [Flavobacteriales bacterium]|nr:(deoxy)nucleoside triphosphate pyrophosphohydrolase [Flavobacteriales bacterium]
MNTTIKKHICQPIHVVAGVIYSETNQILIAKRAIGGFMPGLWEFPGGKIHQAEPSVEALKRELREELAIKITDIFWLMESNHRYHDLAVNLVFYRCQLVKGCQPKATVHDELKWIEPKRLQDFDFLEGNRTAIKTILKNQS